MQIPVRRKPVSLDQSEHVLAKIPATQVIALTACFNSHLETFDQLPMATVVSVGMKIQHQQLEVFLQEGFSTSEISAIESRIKEARAVTEIG